MLTREDKRSIMVGLISSAIFLALIQPIMTATWGSLSAATPRWIEAYTSRFYQSAALGSRNWLDVIFFGFASSVFVGFVPGFLAGVQRRIIDSGEARRNRTSGSVNRARGTSTIGVILFFVVVLGVFHFLLLAFIDLQLTTSFNQRLTVLAPKISIQEEREIRASWASMRSKIDYVSINKRMDDAATDSGITVPRPLY